MLRRRKMTERRFRDQWRLFSLVVPALVCLALVALGATSVVSREEFDALENRVRGCEAELGLLKGEVARLRSQREGTQIKQQLPSGPRIADPSRGVATPQREKGEAGRGFSYSNVSFKPSTPGSPYTECIGEMTNKSGQDYDMVTFTLSAYGRSGTLLARAGLLILEITAGQRKTFDTLLEVTPAEIGNYKIDFDGGLINDSKQKRP
jgi:hypothetical protein